MERRLQQRPLAGGSKLATVDLRDRTLTAARLVEQTFRGDRTFEKE